MKILAEPIDAIVKFKGKDRPLPYKFRYSDKQSMTHEIKIDKVILIEETKIAGIRAYVYRCQREIDGTCKIYELKYLISDCRWELYKM